jgi:hypothetical protein
MPGRKFNTNAYRYGLNGQEMDNELNSIDGAYTSAECWQYDARLGRRWNVDPIVYSWQSPYATFNNDPIYFSDPAGLEGGDKKGDSFKGSDGKTYYTSADATEVSPCDDNECGNSTTPPKIMKLETQTMVKDVINSPSDASKIYKQIISYQVKSEQERKDEIRNKEFLALLQANAVKSREIAIETTFTLAEKSTDAYSFASKVVDKNSMISNAEKLENGVFWTKQTYNFYNLCNAKTAEESNDAIEEISKDVGMKVASHYIPVVNTVSTAKDVYDLINSTEEMQLRNYQRAVDAYQAHQFDKDYRRRMNEERQKVMPILKKYHMEMY